jgi:hypothetical protein
MGDRLSVKNAHDPNIVSDHSTVTGTDVTQTDGTVKRGLDVSPLDTFDISMIGEQFNLMISYQDCILEELKKITMHLSIITDEERV